MPVLLAGCDASRWYRAGWPAPVTVQGRRVLTLWQGSMVAALCVGALVYGLILWAAFRFRKRDNELPRQVRYNIPIEVLYTMVPVVVVSFLFYFTAIDENFENKLSAHPDVTIGVVGFQWSWQFNYDQQNLSVTGRPGQIPELVIPTNKKIRFVETSPDVIHSFWVIPFLFKRDVIPGRENQFEVTVDRTGTFSGKCAEYCGLDHSRMLFKVRAVTWDDYQTWLRNAKAVAASGSNTMFTTLGASKGGTP